MTVAGLRAIGKERAFSVDGARDYCFCSQRVSPPLEPCRKGHSPNATQVQTDFELSEVRSRNDAYANLRMAHALSPLFVTISMQDLLCTPPSALEFRGRNPSLSAAGLLEGDARTRHFECRGGLAGDRITWKREVHGCLVASPRGAGRVGAVQEQREVSRAAHLVRPHGALSGLAERAIAIYRAGFNI